MALLAKGPPPKGYEDELANFAVRRLWLASAWLLGASHRQLGTLHGVSHASILQGINKVISSGDRRKARLHQTMTSSALVWYREQFQNNVETLRHMANPLDVAVWMSTNTPYPGD